MCVYVLHLMYQNVYTLLYIILYILKKDIYNVEMEKIVRWLGGNGLKGKRVRNILTQL